MGKRSDRHYLTPEARRALVGEVFDAMVSLVYLESRKDFVPETRSSNAQSAKMRKSFDDFMAKRHWEEWKAIAKSYSDDWLYGLLEKWTERLDALGIMEWREARGAETAVIAFDRDQNGKKPLEEARRRIGSCRRGRKKGRGPAMGV